MCNLNIIVALLLVISACTHAFNSIPKIALVNRASTLFANPRKIDVGGDNAFQANVRVLYFH